MASSKFPNIKRRTSASAHRREHEGLKASSKAGSALSYVSVRSKSPSVKMENSEGPKTTSNEESNTFQTSNCDPLPSSQADTSEPALKDPDSPDTSSSTVSASLDQVQSVIEVSSLNPRDVKTNRDDDKVMFVQNEEILKDILSPQTDSSKNTTTAGAKTAPPGRSQSQPPEKGESAVFCRICHEVGSTDLFISPCDCKGSLSVVHKRCLERWLAESNSNFCELCGFEYNVMRLANFGFSTMAAE